MLHKDKGKSRKILGMSCKAEVDGKRIDSRTLNMNMPIYNKLNSITAGQISSNDLNAGALNVLPVLPHAQGDKEKEIIQNHRSLCATNQENINRIRLEDMASYWPCAQFISPFCGSPYGMISAPGVAYPMPFFAPNTFAASSASFDNRAQLSSDSNDCNSSSTTISNVSSTSTSKILATIPPIKYEDASANNTIIILNQKQFNELTRLAMRGCETAERIAYTHRNRPCFKKIDSLCARMKQDLIRPDGVLPNINSQGIAWAVKDFIFVFTRIINAWIIIKGYVYNTPDGLNKIKSSLSSDFMRSFVAWQDTTMDFVENLIRSFVNLDQLVQSQKTPFPKNDDTNKSNSSTPVKNSNPANNFETNEIFDESFDFLNVTSEANFVKSATQNQNGNITESLASENNSKKLNKSYYSTLIEDSEESQRKATVNGTYFKTGVYNPIMKDSISETDPLYLAGKKETTDSTSDTVSSTTTKMDKISPIIFDSSNIQHFESTNTQPIENSIWSNQQNSLGLTFPSETVSTNTENSAELLPNIYCAPTKGEGDGKLSDLTKNLSIGNIPRNFFVYDFKILEQNVSKFSNTFDPNVTKPIGYDTVKKLEALLKKLQTLQEGSFFFDERFMKNYFPEFMERSPKFLDLRSIIVKAQVGGYGHINAIINDLKLITYYATVYLKNNKHDFLETAIKKYDLAINKVLKDEIFKDCDFENFINQSNVNI